ncbi:MAG: redoxin domain-containing protein [bacterium]|nr:MAG: redoxin domain-containing protein [bacterium]
MKRLAAGMVAALVIAYVSFALGAESESATEYKKVLNELQRKSRTVSTYEFIDTAERLLLGFLKIYPDSPEAAGANFNLGKIYSSIGRNKEAIDHLNVYLQADVPKDQKEEGAARFALANSYLAMENFDGAEKLLRELLKSGALKDNRMRQMASMQVARIATLRKLRIGLPAIGFSMQSAGGEKITLDSYKGKVVLLDFWASWCAPCRNEMPNVKKVYNHFHDKGFEIIGISLDDKKYKFDSYVDTQQLPWPQIYDGKGWMSEVGQLYAVNSIPATYLLDRQGKIRYKNVRGKELHTAIAKLIAEE